jgi:hypothetical protein
MQRFDRVTTDDETAFSIQPGNKTPEHAVENTEFTSAKKSMPSMARSQFKTMFVSFFEHKGILHYEFIAQGQMVN